MPGQPFAPDHSFGSLQLLGCGCHAGSRPAPPGDTRLQCLPVSRQPSSQPGAHLAPGLCVPRPHQPLCPPRGKQVRRAARTLVWRLLRLDLAPAPSLVLHLVLPGYPPIQLLGRRCLSAMVWAFWTHEPRSRRQNTLPALPRAHQLVDESSWSRTRFPWGRNTKPVVLV